MASNRARTETGSKKKEPTTMKSGSKSSSPVASNELAAEESQKAVDSAIPPAVAKEIRRLSHDLSNALEIIVQCSYLLSTSDIPEASRAWVTLLDQGVLKSTSINQELRAFIQSHS
jgi:hypothetical protein